MTIPFPPICQECGQKCERGYRTLYGIETSGNPYKFCSILCLMAWLVPHYLSAARVAEKKRIPYKEAKQLKEHGENRGSVLLGDLARFLGFCFALWVVVNIWLQMKKKKWFQW